MPSSITLHIPALDCPDELSLVQKSLRGVQGVEQILPDYLGRKVRIDFDAAQTDGASIRDSIEAAGFPAQIVLPTVTTQAAIASETSQPAARLSMFVGGLLLFAAVLARLIMGKMMPPVIGLAIASSVVCGFPVASAAWRAIRLRSLDMNVLMSIAAAGAIGIGDYFEAATAMFLFAVSLWLEKLSLARAQRAIRSLVEVAPDVAHRVSERGTAREKVLDIAPNELAMDDEVLVRPGERIPADGEVISGESAVNQAPITGESMPVNKQIADRVFAGTLNGEGSLVVKVTSAANNTTLARIARLIDEARASRSPTERFVDSFARRYTPVVVGLALAIMIGPPLMAHFGVAWASSVGTFGWIERGLVLLVIACPCALVISTPVTIVSGLNQASRIGILVKGGELLEKSAAIETVALDKTGTLTTGALQVVGIESFDGISETEVLAIAAGLEQHSEHPLARAIAGAAEERNITAAQASGINARRGFGLSGEVNGRGYSLGNAKMFVQAKFAWPDGELVRHGIAADGVAALEGTDRKADAMTNVWLGAESRILGHIQLQDSMRPEAESALADLRRLGVRRLVMLTGDNTAAANRIAANLDIDEVHAELLPQDKIDVVRSLRGNGKLAMVGDGVNDAPALAAADVGIALGGTASDTAIETADVVIMSADLAKIPELIRLARRCRNILKQNIAFSLSTKLVVIALAAFGMATMWLAVAADVGTSLLVIANGLRLIGKRSA